MVLKKRASCFMLLLFIGGCSDNTPLVKDSVSVRTDNNVVNTESFSVSMAKKYPKDVYIEGRTYTKRVALTFDDGPTRNTLHILDILKEHEVSATFFLIGEQLEKFPDIALRTLAENHHLGNHSLRHEHGASWTAEEFWGKSTAQTNIIFEQKLGFMPTFFRPPYGEITEEQVQLLIEKGMKSIFWSIDTKDWNLEDVSSSDIATTVKNNMHEEAIVLMHDNGVERDRVLNTLPEIIQYYKDNHYTFVTIGELLGVEQAL